MRVRAKLDGFYDGKVRTVGEEFVLHDIELPDGTISTADEHFSKYWMDVIEPVDKPTDKDVESDNVESDNVESDRPQRGRGRSKR